MEGYKNFNRHGEVVVMRVAPGIMHLCNLSTGASITIEDNHDETFEISGGSSDGVWSIIDDGRHDLDQILVEFINKLKHKKEYEWA